MRKQQWLEFQEELRISPAAQLPKLAARCAAVAASVARAPPGQAISRRKRHARERALRALKAQLEQLEQRVQAPGAAAP